MIRRKIHKTMSVVGVTALLLFLRASEGCAVDIESVRREVLSTAFDGRSASLDNIIGDSSFAPAILEFAVSDAIDDFRRSYLLARLSTELGNMRLDADARSLLGERSRGAISTILAEYPQMLGDVALLVQWIPEGVILTQLVSVARGVDDPGVLDKVAYGLSAAVGSNDVTVLAEAWCSAEVDAFRGVLSRVLCSMMINNDYDLLPVLYAAKNKENSLCVEGWLSRVIRVAEELAVVMAYRQDLVSTDRVVRVDSYRRFRSYMLDRHQVNGQIHPGEDAESLLLDFYSVVESWCISELEPRANGVGPQIVPTLGPDAR